ncbi:MAG TPA: VOC family protein [Acidimicrobiia bacterium]
MLEVLEAICSFSVDDIDAAKSFYGQSLGLEVEPALPGEGGPFWLRDKGARTVFIYPKSDHQPASFTVFNLTVADIAVAVDHLNSLGVTMERYPDYPADDRGIVEAPGHLIAWFKDPARNGLSVVQMRGA